MDVRGVQREQPYWGPKEKASQRLVAHASDASHKTAARAALSAQCKAVARAALKPAQRQPSPDWDVVRRRQKTKALSAWSHNHVELSANDRHRAHLTPRQVYHEI